MAQNLASLGAQSPFFEADGFLALISEPSSLQLQLISAHVKYLWQNNSALSRGICFKELSMQVSSGRRLPLGSTAWAPTDLGWRLLHLEVRRAGQQVLGEFDGQVAGLVAVAVGIERFRAGKEDLEGKGRSK